MLGYRFKSGSEQLNLELTSHFYIFAQMGLLINKIVRVCYTIFQQCVNYSRLLFHFKVPLKIFI